MGLAREGLREMLLSTLVLGALGTGAAWIHWSAALPFVLVWVWVIAFFRDPVRRGTFAPGELCSGADGTVTEVTELDHYAPLGGPAIRIGAFLSIFNVHINRAPCAGRVRSVEYKRGEFLDARHRESGYRNESNAVILDPDGALPGPIEIRQVAGFVARRIVCHAKPGDRLSIGQRFGLIKFGSRTEIVIPRLPKTEILVKVGDPIRAGVTLIARLSVRQSASPRPEESRPPASHELEHGGRIGTGVTEIVAGGTSVAKVTTSQGPW